MRILRYRPSARTTVAVAARPHTAAARACSPTQGWEDWLAVLRRVALALLALAPLVAASAHPAAAAPPPTLTGQHFFDDGGTFANFPAPDVICRSNADGTETWRFEAAASTGAPYASSFSETGELTVGPPPGGLPPHRDVLSLRSEFTIDSPSGQVSGTKRLPAPAEDAVLAHCESSGDRHLVTETPLRPNYSATITTAGGVFADRGQASLTLDREGFWTFNERFTSGLAATEQQDSILLGKRTPGSSFSATSANAKRAVAFPLYFPATVRKLHAYIDGKTATFGSQTLRGVLYAIGPGNAPGALLARSFQFTVPAGMSRRWLELYLAPAIRLNPGVYWLGLHSGATGGVARFAWDPRDNSRRFNVDYYPDGPSNPFGSAALDNQRMSIFASGSY